MENKKKKKTQIDIILPNYNSHEFIEETIKSVKNQSYSNWKLTIVDDNSNKKTKQILKIKKLKFIGLKKIKVQDFVEITQLKKQNLLI